MAYTPNKINPFDTIYIMANKTNKLMDDVQTLEQSLQEEINNKTQPATTSSPGIVKLNDSTNSSSTTEAATPNAVKKTYERAILAEDNAKAYTDEQIALVTETGIPKLVSYQYLLTASTNNQTDFDIPLSTFDPETDTVVVIQNRTPLEHTAYEISDFNSDGTYTIRLNEGVDEGTDLHLIILKNVPIGPEGSINGRVLATNSVPLDRLEEVVETPTEAQQKATQAEQNAKDYADQQLASHLADTTAHGIGDKSTLLTTNKNTIVEAINELFTNADNGKSSIATVIGSPATSGDTFSQLATHITNHKNALASSLGSGSSADSLQTLVSTRLQGLKNTLATNLTNKGQSSSGSETLQNLINKVASISTGKRFMTGSVTSSSRGEDFSGLGGGRYRYPVVVNGLTFKPSIILVYTGSNVDREGSVTVYKSGGVVKDGYIYEIAETTHHFYLGNTGSIFGTTNTYVTSSGFKLPARKPSQVYDWIAIE